MQIVKQFEALYNWIRASIILIRMLNSHSTHIHISTPLNRRKIGGGGYSRPRENTLLAQYSDSQPIAFASSAINLNSSHLNGRKVNCVYSRS